MGATKHHKLTSFLAQSNTVSCLSIGPKSSRVLVTGGLDRIVNLWAIGNHSPVLSLQGHVTSIHSVAMDWPEELVVAGSSGGCLKLWDLQEAKVIRTLAGHRASIGAVEFHPFGEFFASGSADQSVKIWDVRRKGCIQTYHGHSDAINSLEITPDGRWIASASDDGTVKIWDMTAGKLLHTLDDAAGPILSVTFNPSEFVIATTSQDGSIRVYDLQSFDCISTYNDTYSKFILFSPNGQQLLTCCQDALQVLSWDPISLITEINVNWSNVKDLKVLPDNDKAIACTTNGNYVDVWAFQLPLSQVLYFCNFILGGRVRFGCRKRILVHLIYRLWINLLTQTTNFSLQIPS
ncbi:WD40-repeat-containing domain protein [Globomyces pollinis-pini]|nr:WD40-repeat-containing domain protein [Globomyces pollinis-pini]